MKSKRVLIVDDNDLNRKLFENLIGQLFSVESAKNGLEAVELAKAMDFNLILMDIQMPLMDGITAMKKIRQETNLTCPILAVTAYAEESDRNSFLEQGFDDFVTKPIRPKDFIQLVQGYLKGQTGTIKSSEAPQEEDPVMDKKILTQLLKYNSEQAIQKVFAEFLVECEETEELIDSFDKNSPIDDLLGKIHILKGNSGTLGAMRVYHHSARAEDYGRSGKTGEFGEEIKKLRNEMGQFRDFFHQEPIFGL